MKAITLILFVLLVNYDDVPAPDWLDFEYRRKNFPKDEYYQGFVSRSYNAKENIIDVESEVVSQSRIRMSESIRVFISSKSTSTLSNSNTESNERYQQTSITRTELEASGLETLTYFDERKKVAYAFSFVKKRKLQSSYYRELKEVMGLVKSQIDGYKEKTPPYRVLMEMLSQLDRAKGIQNALSYTGINNSIVLMTSQWNQRRDWVTAQIDDYKGKESIGLEEAAILLRDGLVSDINRRSLADVKINRMTYKNTGIASELSVLFGDYFEDAMTDRFSVVREEYDWVVSSTYWPLKDKIKITATIHQSSDGELLRLIASTSINVSLEKVLALNIDFEPLKTAEDVREYEVVTLHDSDGDIMVDIATQKGNQSSVFMEGESLKLLTKVSRPSYIQLINIWSDGSKLLLLDNFYVDIDQINQYIELPFEWETSCPCGVEYIYVLASETPHLVPETIDNDGFLFIKEPIEEVIDSKRGFKRKEGQVVSESSLILTTIPSRQ